MTAEVFALNPEAEYERIYVATIVAMPKLYEVSRVSPDDVANDGLRAILASALAVHMAGRRVTRLALRAELERTGLAKLIGTLDSLGPVEVNLEPVAERVRTLATLRRLRADAKRLSDALSRGDLGRAREAISALSLAHDAGSQEDPVMTFGELMQHGIEQLQRAWKDDAMGAGPIALAIPSRERIHLSAGSLLTLGAQTNVGKSSLLITWMLGLAQRGIPCGIVSVEDPAEDWATKALGEMSGINPARMWSGKLRHDEWPALSDAAVKNRDIPLSTSFVSDRSLDGVLSRMEFMARVRGCRVIAVDYLQAIAHRSGKDIRERTDRTLEELIAQAGRLGVALILASQLSRPDKGSPFREPNLIDLKESGSIENRSQTVVLLWRENDQPGTPVRAKVAKVKRRAAGSRFDLTRNRDGRLVELARAGEFGGDDE